MKALFIWAIVATVTTAIAIMVAIIIGLGAQNLNKDLIVKTRSQRGSIQERDTILSNIKMNSHGKGRIDKIRLALEDWEDLKKYERRGIEPVGTGLPADLSADLGH
jgi:hypothetical protein